jgi:hypothetical protein
MKPLVHALLGLLLVGGAQAVGAEAAMTPVAGPGYALQLPAGWDLRRNATEVPLYARATAPGWEGVSLAVNSQRLDDPASCLDGQTQRRLRALAEKATAFEQLEEQRLQLDGLPAYEYVLRYRLGERELSAYLLTVAGEGRWASALLSADPAHFELRRRELRQIVESLRPRRHDGPDYQPPKRS